MNKNLKGVIGYRMVSGFAQFIVILAGALVIILAIVFFAFKNGQIKFAPTVQTSPTPTSNPTKDWKLHTNENLRFSVKLPIDLEILKETKTKVDFATIPPMTEPYVTFTSQLTNFDSTQLCKEGQLVAPCIISDYWDKDSRGKEEIELGGVVATRFNIWRTVGRNETVIQTTQIPKIEIRFLSNEGYRNEILFRQILSTFIFAE